ncbi:FAD/NAD(P)-binding domain-containing protein [Aureobasidium sp. EXF-8845]|nr:FAD/NAD(P)-binding domain-containing protein [Aureobasidium sp. EXF-8845]
MPNLPDGTASKATFSQHLDSSHEVHDDPRIPDTLVENQRPLKVIVIGAGYSGIYHGIRIPERIRNCELVIYEKNAGVGGTWYENRYPGCACDIPSHSYQYSFNPNPKWSSLYAPAQEIQAYLESTAKKYSVDRFIKLQHEIISCTFDQGRGKWLVKVRGPDGQIFADDSDVLISARGGLNDIAWPQIKGLKTFQGELMHSASWNDDYDFKFKRVGVIGSGSSAIQIIPKLQQVTGTQLACFIRSRTWISPPFGELQQEPSSDFPTGIVFSESQRNRFQADPEHLHAYRMDIERSGNATHALTIMGTRMQTGAQARFEQSMKARLAKRPEYYDMIKPSFAPGCRRLTPGPGFLEALVEDNVGFINTPIIRAEPRGIVTADGNLHEIDVLVCATGFNTGAPPPFEVLGSGGSSLGEHWTRQGRPATYMSLATHGFPNFYMMLGPNGAVGTGSLTTMIESTADYIIKCIRKQQKENIKSMVIKASRVQDFSRLVDHYFKKTVFMDDCKSWYRKGDKITGLWPGSALHCMEALRSPRWEDFDYEYLGGDEHKANQLSWLGNGWSIHQLGQGDLAWYLRPEYQDIPTAPLPEANEFHAIRTFSQ